MVVPTLFVLPFLNNSFRGMKSWMLSSVWTMSFTMFVQMHEKLDVVIFVYYELHSIWVNA
jgi:hypothetical protein